MLEEMFEKSDAEVSDGNYPDEFLGRGQYESDPNEILEGFRVFQKRHVYGNLVIQLFLVAAAASSQVVSIVYDTSGDIAFNVMLITFCVFLGIWLFMRPINTRKTLQKAIENLKGTIYEAEIYADRIKISTIYDAPVENGDDDKTEEEPPPEEDTGDSEDEDEGIPATIIHLDNAGVEITETDTLYVVYVKKVNIFVIPKSAFTDEEITNIREKLEPLMGVRFR